MQDTKVYISALKKSFKVRHTNRNMKLSYKFQLSIAKMSDVADDDAVKQNEEALHYYDTLLEFPVALLKLTDAQAEKLDEMDADDLQMLDVKLALTTQGVKKSAIEATLQDMKSASIEDEENEGAEDKVE